ncbi:MAG: hypothetical protein ACOC1G_09040, partial [Phycisphaeraceae bacterium]
MKRTGRPHRSSANSSIDSAIVVGVLAAASIDAVAAEIPARPRIPRYITPAISAPEFCPRPGCRYFDRNTAASEPWYICYGSFRTRARGTIRRFRCTACGKTCSTQTFSIHYWSHSDCDFALLAEKLLSGCGLLQHARSCNQTFRVVQNRIRRL